MKIMRQESIKLLPEHIYYGAHLHLLKDPYPPERLVKACFAEFLSCVYLTAIGGGTAASCSNPDILMVAISFGLNVYCIAQFTGPVSGAHMNIAVSFAMYFDGRISLVRCISFGFAQFAGAFVGGLIVYSIFGTIGVNTWNEEVFTVWQVFLGEMIATMFLIWIIFATIDTPENDIKVLGIFPIAMTVTVSKLFLMPVDGCSINPTASLGVSIVAALITKPGNYLNQVYMFWLAPLTGSIVAVWLYDLLLLRKKPSSWEDTLHGIEKDIESLEYSISVSCTRTTRDVGYSCFRSDLVDKLFKIFFAFFIGEKTTVSLNVPHSASTGAAKGCSPATPSGLCTTNFAATSNSEVSTEDSSITCSEETMIPSILVSFSTSVEDIGSNPKPSLGMSPGKSKQLFRRKLSWKKDQTEPLNNVDG